MSLPSTKKWIVIIDRSPRGPLTEEEVKTLLASQIVRMNSIACLAAETGAEEKTEWKFLWQFDEFERRKPLTEIEKEKNFTRRKPPTPEQTASEIQSKLREVDPSAIPEELKSVSMSDLVPTTKKTARPFGSENEIQDAAINKASSSGPDFQIAMKAWFAAAGILFIGGAFFLNSLLSNTPLLNTPKTAVAPPKAVRAPAARPSAPGRTSLLNSAPKRREDTQIDPDDPFLKAAKLKEDAERDRGHIAEDDFGDDLIEEQSEEAAEKTAKKSDKESKSEENRDTASDEAPDSEASAPKAKSKTSDNDGQDGENSSEPEPEE